MTSVEPKQLSNKDILNNMLNALEDKLDAFNKDHILYDSYRKTNMKSINRKLYFINKKM